MSNVFCFYFDGAIVQAVKASIFGDTVTVKDARTFPQNELDDYLSHCSEKSCIVCSNPPLFYQDIIHLPPAAGKLYNKLVRTEIRNAHPDLGSFSIFHRTIGESTIDSRPYSKIAAFSYPDDFLAGSIQSINRSGLSISAVYSAPCSVFRLALSTCAADYSQPRIFIATLPGEKLLLVSERSEMGFIRKIPSLDNAMLQEDAQNINMTVDYCLQTLRVRPFEAVLLNQPDPSEDLSPLVSVPYRVSLPPRLKDVPSHIIQDYLAPVATILHSTDSPRFGNILPADYADFKTHKKMFTTATMLMLLLTLGLAGYLVTERMIISGLDSDIGRIRTELSGSANDLATFRKLDADANLLKQPLDFINKHTSTLNPATALAALALPESGDYTIREITVRNGDEFLTVQIEGAIFASGYRDAQDIFEKLVALIAKIQGYAISSSSLDIKQKSFSVQARYNGGGQKGK